MTTMGLIRKQRVRKDYKSRSPALYGNPQQSGIVKKSFITTPRKPNSAKRKTAKVVLRRTRRIVDIYLEGIDFNKLNPHSLVLVRGKGPRDLPGVNYHAIRGKGDFPPLLNRRKGRSKYGAKRVNVTPVIAVEKRMKHKKSEVLLEEKLEKYRYLQYGYTLHSLKPTRRYY